MTSERGAGRSHRAARRLSIAAPLALIALAILVVSLLARGGETTTSTLPTSTDRNAFVLPRLKGAGFVRLADFRGMPLVVNFYASWCTPCRGELPGFARVADQFRGRVAFLFVNSQETGDGLAMAHELGVDTHPLARDVGGAHNSGLHDGLAVNVSMPTTVFYDAGGSIRYVSPGALPEETLRAKLRSLFGVG